MRQVIYVASRLVAIMTSSQVCVPMRGCTQIQLGLVSSQTRRTPRGLEGGVWCRPLLERQTVTAQAGRANGRNLMLLLHVREILSCDVREDRQLVAKVLLYQGWTGPLKDILRQLRVAEHCLSGMS